MKAPQVKRGIRLLLADDHPVVRGGLAAVLGAMAGVEVVAEAGNGAEAIEKFRAVQPDVALIDLSMPIVGGVEAIRAIRREFAGARLVALTVLMGDEDVFRAFEAGASAYVLKKAPIDEIVEVLRLVHRGERRIPLDVAARLSGRTVSEGLSDREKDVLVLVARGLSNQEIAEKLEIGVRTVKSHLTSLMAKLEVESRTRAVAVAVERGIVHM